MKAKACGYGELLQQVVVDSSLCHKSKKKYIEDKLVESKSECISGFASHFEQFTKRGSCWKNIQKVFLQKLFIISSCK